MRINELELTNFKGIRSLHLIFDGADAKIYGDNATGKTTVMDAFIWLLTGKDHLGRSDFCIKTLDETGAAIPMLEHSVRAVVEHNGNTFELLRIFKEVWQKKTGSTVQTFTGHKTEYYIDMVPRTEKEYSAFVSQIAPPTLLNLLIMPAYFNEQIKAEERRKLLLDMCGDVDEAEMLSLPQFSKLAAHMTKQVSVADLKKAKTAQKAKINDELKTIPVAINVHRKYLDAASGLNAAIEQAAIDVLEARTRGLEIKLNGLRNGEEISKLRKELAELEAEQINLNNASRQARDQEIQKVRKELTEAQDNLLKATQERRLAEMVVAETAGSIERLRAKKRLQLEAYHKLAAEEFSADTVCPTCGQAIPEEAIEAARQQFNQRKAQELEEIVRGGKALAAEIAEMEAKCEKAKEELAATVEREASFGRTVKEIEARIHEMKNAPLPAFDTSAIDEKRAEIAALVKSSETQEADLASQIKRLSDEKGEHEQNLARLKTAESAAEEIKKLEEREKELAAAFEECEELITLCDDFTNTRVKMLDERISGFFRLARFKLTETLINGGLREICDTMVDGVPYSSANNAAKINVGLDIIRTFSQHYGISLPVFIDNAESVTNLEKIDAQTIQLIVSPQHQTLTMEVI